LTKQRGESVTNSRSTCCLRIAFDLTIGPSSYEEASIGSLLHEVSHEERDPEACPDHDEEWKTGHARNLRDLRDKAIPHREELGSQRADRDRRRSHPDAPPAARSSCSRLWTLSDMSKSNRWDGEAEGLGRGSLSRAWRSLEDRRLDRSHGFGGATRKAGGKPPGRRRPRRTGN
jgi:hypothetical protein